jgi:hypothetical protein
MSLSLPSRQGDEKEKREAKVRKKAAKGCASFAVSITVDEAFYRKH